MFSVWMPFSFLGLMFVNLFINNIINGKKKKKKKKIAMCMKIIAQREGPTDRETGVTDFLSSSSGNAKDPLSLSLSHYKTTCYVWSNSVIMPSSFLPIYICLKAIPFSSHFLDITTKRRKGRSSLYSTS